MIYKYIFDHADDSNIFHRHMWSSFTVPENASEPQRWNRCLAINRGKFWFPPKGDRVLVARRTSYMRKLLELSVLPTHTQIRQGGVGAGDWIGQWPVTQSWQFYRHSIKTEEYNVPGLLQRVSCLRNQNTPEHHQAGPQAPRGQNTFVEHLL